jgi:transposase
MRRVFGMDIHRTFGEVVIWDDGKLRNAGRVDMTRTALEGFGKGLHATDEVVIEATGNCMAVSRVLSPFVARVRNSTVPARVCQPRSRWPLRWTSRSGDFSP